MAKEAIKIVTISQEYGKYILTLPDGTTSKHENVNDLMSHCENVTETLENETVTTTVFAGDEDSVLDTMDLTMITAMLAWGKQLYAGDCLKITITAEYCPENK